MSDDPQPRKIPLVFFRADAGRRTGARVAERAGGSGAAGDREGPAPSAMAVAGRDAAVPPHGKRSLGSPDEPHYETDSAGVALPLPRAPGGVARVHQENASHAG